MGANTKVGIKVNHKFGTKPTLSIPRGPAPSSLVSQVLTVGTGRTVGKGDLLVANYVGETWAPKNGRPNVFDSSFARGTPAAFPIGVGRVIPGWDKTLVGKKLGSRVLLTVPPADGYPNGQPQAHISKNDTLVFVVDLIAGYPPGASAPGTALGKLRAGWPRITNTPGKQPEVRSTSGVKKPTAPKSTLAVKGKGAPIKAGKTLVVQVVETDLATGKHTHSTWNQTPQAVPTQQVLQVADALTGQKVGSRAVVLLPARPGSPGSNGAPSQPPSPPEILILDVVGQF